MAADKFLVSVANAIGLDPVTREVIFLASANAQSGLTLSMTTTDVRGGKGNPIRYRYMHDRMLEGTVQGVTFTKEWLALNVGETITTGTVQVVEQECLNFVAGATELTKDPVSNVSVLTEEGDIYTVVPSGKNITIPGSYDGKADVVYSFMAVADRVSISTNNPPSVITLVLTADVRDSNGKLVEYFQAEIPSFQVDGNYELTMTADGVSQESLNGTALNVRGMTCQDGDIYGYVTWIPAEEASISYVDIAAVPTVIPATVGEETVAGLVVYGLRGGIYSNVNITADCTYALEAPVTGVSVSAAGVVTVLNTASAGEATVVVTYVSDTTTYTDLVTVNIEA